MAYQTGSFTTIASLKTAIETFCTTYSWTLTSGVLSKGLSYIKLTAASANMLTIQGANSVDFLTTPCPTTQAIYLSDPDLTTSVYHLFTHANPDIVVCAIEYADSRIQPIIFGDIVKVHSSAFVGGNFFFAPRYPTYPTNVSSFWYLNDENVASANGGPFDYQRNYPFMPFCNTAFSNYSGTPFHAEIDTDINLVWGTITTTLPTTTLLSATTTSSYFRSPNTWDSHAHLIPIQVMYTMKSSFVAYLGYIEHIRLVRIDNYNLGDIITIGTDTWKVFPWVKKESTYPTGRSGGSLADDMALLGASGCLGFAVRYDGP